MHTVFSVYIHSLLHGRLLRMRVDLFHTLSMCNSSTAALHLNLIEPELYHRNLEN